jgi:hypothetical protein
MDRMSDEDRLDDRILDAVRGYNAPPETVPRDAMWAGVAASRQARAAERAARRDHLRTWLPIGAGLAAALALGVGIGRVSVHPDGGARGPIAGVYTPSTNRRPSSATHVEAYRLAATEHLARAEALLTTFRSESQTGRLDPQVAGNARDLLSTTQLMLDTPVARDPRMRKLLDDLELVLAQIAQLRQQHSGDEIQLIDQAVRDRDVLSRLRTAVPAGALPAGT